MKIYTYYEDINFQDQDRLLALWKASWERQGFEAIILNRLDAESHPYYNVFVSELERLHIEVMQKPLSKYGLSCYLRWLAYANQPEEKFYVSDYDVINNKFLIQEPDNQLHFMDGDCPCIASGTSKQFEELCYSFVEITKERLESIKGNVTPHYHDQEFLTQNMTPRCFPEAEKYLKKYNILMTRDRTMLNGMISDLEKESDIANFQLVHFSHSFASHYKQKTQSNINRTELACKISWEHFKICPTMFKNIKDNKNIFQICINLNDNVDSLKESRRKLLDLNPDYDFHYITSQEEFEEFMQIHFKNSEDVFEQKIYEVFNCIPTKLHRKAPAPDEDIEKLEKAFRVCVLVSRTDVFRYAALYKFGGFYLDLSSLAEVDIKQKLEKYDCMFLKSPAEIRSSICYAKKHSFIIKTILENIIFHCLSRHNVIHQMQDVGPGVVTETILNIIDGTPFNEFKQFNNDEIRDKLEKINEFSLEKHNSIILSKGDEHQKYIIEASWKRGLHTPDPSRPELIPNHHWLGWFMEEQKNEQNKQNELSILMERYGSDKWGGWHNYTNLYHEIFCKIKTEVKNLLEVGLGTKNADIKSNMVNLPKTNPGGSLRAWKDYFVNANVYGLDIDKDILFNEERINTFYCDQTNKDDITNFLNSECIKNLEFDIIIDDGLHTYDANYSFLINSFHKLKRGGIYVVEDVTSQTAQSFKNEQQKLKDILCFSEFDIHELEHPRNKGDNRLLVIKK